MWSSLSLSSETRLAQVRCDTVARPGMTMDQSHPISAMGTTSHHQITLMTFIRLRHDIQGGTRLNISIQNHPNLCSNNEVWDNVDNVCTTDIELLSSYSCMTSSCQYGYLPICYASIHCLRYNKLLLEFDPRLIGTVATAGSSLATVFYRATDFSQNISI